MRPSFAEILDTIPQIISSLKKKDQLIMGLKL